ncbi:MAG: hypothetical protein LBB18_02005, partial [Puniceicoccales bacterium]|nr:hypothetical protein [Puniceicoccales bacterium]
MNRVEKANFIFGKLNELFPNPDAQLDFSNDFTCLVAVMLSARCTDATVNRICEELFKLAKTPGEFVDLGEQKLKKIIKPCGFFNAKAKAISNTARIILEKHGGKVPGTFQEL